MRRLALLAAAALRAAPSSNACVGTAPPPARQLSVGRAAPPWRQDRSCLSPLAPLCLHASLSGEAFAAAVPSAQQPSPNAVAAAAAAAAAAMPPHQRQPAPAAAGASRRPPVPFGYAAGQTAAPAASPAAAATVGPVEAATPCGLASAAVAPGTGESYTIRVATGRRRGSGTEESVFVRLVGTTLVTEPIHLMPEDGFERGSVKEFSATLPAGLGPIRRLHVSKTLDVLNEPFTRGWFLKQIEVTREGAEATVFPCNSWIGYSDCGSYHGSCERNLLPANLSITSAAHVEPVRISAAGMAIPLPEKIVDQASKGVNRQGFGYGGEDAYFFCEGRHGTFGMGVADGIYGWRDAGVDSGEMSRALMRTAMDMVAHGLDDVYKVLDLSTRHVLAEGLRGSCTASLLVVHQSTGLLHAANLGDSGFLVLSSCRASGRMSGETTRYEVKYRSYQLEHEFGRPFQVGHHEHASDAEDADLVSFHVQRGDIIVMGTDGLLDNLTDEEICEELEVQCAMGGSPTQMTHALVKAAFEASVDARRDTPYARDASEAFNMVYRGGKKDDITVLVAMCS